MNQLHRRMGTFALMMVGLGSMIGSGWLFGAWRAAQIADLPQLFPGLSV